VSTTDAEPVVGRAMKAATLHLVLAGAAFVACGLLLAARSAVSLAREPSHVRVLGSDPSRPTREATKCDRRWGRTVPQGLCCWWKD
jgi:hypothetical protein